MSDLRTHIIIVAAGSGSRFGAPLPKQYCLLAGRPVVMHAIDNLRQACPQATMTIVIASDMVDYWLDLCQQYNFESPAIVKGGSTRWESVKHAVDSISDNPDVVMVHDGARPFPSEQLIKELLDAMHDLSVDVAVPAISVTDSLRLIQDDTQTSVQFDRSRLRAVQTPQALRANKLREAFDRPYQSSFTDDASVMESAGYDNIIITQGTPVNIKITNPLDIAIAETILSHNAQ